jgi:hypothetical protein
MVMFERHHGDWGGPFHHVARDTRDVDFLNVSAPLDCRGIEKELSLTLAAPRPRQCE